MLYLYVGLGVIAFLAIGFGVSILIVTQSSFKNFFCRKDVPRDELTDAHYAPYRKPIADARARMEALPHEELVCRAFDGIELYARYYDFGKSKTVIFMHGVFSHPMNNFAVIAERFIKWGFNVLMPDQRAHGRSGGENITYGYSESRDLLKWIELMREQAKDGIVLYGTSMGATTVALALDSVDTKVRVAVCDCGFTSMASDMKYIAKKHHAPYLLFRSLIRTCRKRLGIDLNESAETHLKNSSVPTVFVHGLDDTAVPYTESVKNHAACAAPKELILAEGCGHTTAAMSEENSEKIRKFINLYI